VILSYPYFITFSNTIHVNSIGFLEWQSLGLEISSRPVHILQGSFFLQKGTSFVLLQSAKQLPLEYS
jgi:hypothetical protein